MHEVDPQSDQQAEDRTEARLTEALRRMAAASRQGAGPEVGAGLVMAFRRHHTRRRRIRRTGIAALGICMMVAAVLVSMRDSGKKRQEATKAPVPVTNTAEHKNPTAPAPPAPEVKRTVVKEASARPKATRPAQRAATRAFLALPAYDPGVPMDELNVVRVRLPESALWKMGAPVRPDAGMRRVTADFVVSQDGTPYAVRLVQ
jgi:hypothetical protein